MICPTSENAYGDDTNCAPKPRYAWKNAAESAALCSLSGVVPHSVVMPATSSVSTSTMKLVSQKITLGCVVAFANNSCATRDPYSSSSSIAKSTSCQSSAASSSETSSKS